MANALKESNLPDKRWRKKLQAREWVYRINLAQLRRERIGQISMPKPLR